MFRNLQFIKKITVLLFILFLISCSFDWSYKQGKYGPDNWGNLLDGQKYRFCKIGYNQSPINITKDFTDKLEFNYDLTGVEKIKKKHFLKLDFFERNYLTRVKKKYFLRHIIFRHPSEHEVNYKKASLEMQIFHKSDDEQWLAVSKLIEVGEVNKDFMHIVDFINSKEKESKIDLSKLFNNSEKFFFYDGSFTTPPCFEGVKWYVSKDKLEISKDQMNQIIKKAIYSKINSRPIQAFHPELY